MTRHNAARTRAKTQRTRTGCQTCRTRRVKCDEKKPSCTQCRRGDRDCLWTEQPKTRPRTPRRPNATACDACRDKKLKCIGDVCDTCQNCQTLGLECVRRLSRAQPASPLPAPVTAHTTQQAQLPETKELDDLIQLYFASVHHFGFFAFIHPLHFQRLLDDGKAPRELTLMMIASALRFASPLTSKSLARADAWADAAINALVPRIHQGFGAVQLMTTLLAQHYDMHRGHFTSAWLLGGNCTRMMQLMSLHTFDRTYPMEFPSGQRLSPLLSRESLRRLAWSTFYLDSMIDGGRYGSQTVDERAFRIQLPCDQESFLGDDQAVTEPLIPGYMPALAVAGGIQASLDMSAYVLRVAAARRRALHFAFRASYQENSVSRLSDGLLELQHDLEGCFADLPRRFEYNQDNMTLHQQRLPMFILLHVLRQNLFIILGRAALQVYLRDPAKVSLINQVRRDRITRASMVANLVSEGLKSNVIFDPHIGVQAYVAFEILLLEPRRLAAVNEPHGHSDLELSNSLSNLLKTIRSISARSEFTKHLYLEAIHRLIRCDHMDILEPQDLEAIRRRNLLVGQEDAEFDFRDFRGAKLERLRKLANVPNTTAPDEVLLEDTTAQEIEAKSGDDSPQAAEPGLDNHSNPLVDDQQGSTSLRESDASLADLATADYSLPQDEQAWRDIVEPHNADHLFAPFNWIWPFDEWGDQFATATGFPSPVQHEPGLYE